MGTGGNGATGYGDARRWRLVVQIEGDMVGSGIGTKTMGRIGRAVLAALAPIAIVLAIGPVSTAIAAGPAVTIGSPSQGSSTAEHTPSFSGTTDDEADPVMLKIYEGAGTGGNLLQTRESGTPVSGVWSAQSSSLGEGTYTAVAEQLDQETLETGVSAPVTFTVDTTAPGLSLNPVSSPTDDPTPSFAGAAGNAPGDLPAVRLKLYAGASASGSPVRTLEVSRSGGTWEAGLAEGLVDGTYTAQAEQSDEAGNTTRSETSTFTVDTKAPTVSLNSVPSPTSDSTPSFSGAAGTASGDLATVKLRIYAGASATGSPLRTVEVTRSGSTWSASSGGVLSDGTYTAQAEQSDTAGNTGRSEASTFTIDTAGPSVSLAAVASPTNNPKVGFSGGAGAAAGDLATVKLKIYAGAVVSGSPMRTVEVTRSGASWSASSGGALGDGTYTAQAEQSDEAGNVAKSASATFTVDTVAPNVNLASGPLERHVSAPKFEGSAGVVAGSSPDIQQVTLKVYRGPSATGTPIRTVVVTPSGGKWSATPSPALANETYTAQAEQSDRAGNVGKSSASTFEIVTKGPVVTLSAVSSPTNDPTPSFSGSAGSASGDTPVTLRIYRGPVASHEAEVRTVQATLKGATWTADLAEGLPDGTYTALAEQSDELKNVGVSAEATFTVDTIAPAVTLTAPADVSAASSASEVVEGGAGSAAGDSSTIAVKLFAGASAGPGAPAETRVVQAVNGRWQVTFEGLAAGEYTVEAEQSDAAGNTGHGGPASFAVTAPAQAPAQPPATSFSWLPSVPQTGETVSLLSSSTDTTSPIAGFAWDLLGTASFNPGQPAISTSFSTPGSHTVRLRVTAADGLSSIASEAIPVSGPTIPLMSPFPVVRIISTDTAAGIRLKLLSVRAAAGAQILVTCRGRGCPAKSVGRVAHKAKKGGVPAYTFAVFERSLRAGVVLEVRVRKAGLIGKDTRLTVHKGRLPDRVDRCLSPSGTKAIACPAA